MPIIDNHSNQFSIDGSGYGFSATRLESLGASEYTLVCIAADTSSSVATFRKEIEECVKQVVKACRHAPRADNLMMRLVQFDTNLKEVHGFKPLMECHVDDYTDALPCSGMTALYDATHNAIQSARRYGKDLTDHGLLTNAIVFVVTDGADNNSSMTVDGVKDAIHGLRLSEELESLTTILVGVDVDCDATANYLKQFSTTVGFDQYIELAQADSKTIAGLADFVSRHIALQSQVLGSGQSTVSLRF